MVSDPTPTSGKEGTPADRKPPFRRPHFLRRLYDWTLHWAYTPYASPALAIMSFAEASFFPVPPDPLLMAMALGRRERSFRYATICSLASILGGILGFVIGYFLMDYVGNPIIEFYGKQEKFHEVVEALRPGMTLWVFVAAFSPIPYKVFTIAAGMVAYEMTGNPWMFFGGFVAASAIGRSARFFLVAWLIHRFGKPIERFIDKYFNWCALAFTVLLVGAAYALKYLL